MALRFRAEWAFVRACAGAYSRSSQATTVAHGGLRLRSSANQAKDAQDGFARRTGRADLTNGFQAECCGARDTLLPRRAFLLPAS